MRNNTMIFLFLLCVFLPLPALAFNGTEEDKPNILPVLMLLLDGDDNEVTPTSPHVVFVTSVTGNGNLNTWADAGGNIGLAAGDAICQARADAAGLQGTFVAWLSDNSNDAYCRVQGLSGEKADTCGQDTLPTSAGPWVRTDGFPFGETIDQLLDLGIVYSPLIYDEFGDYVGFGYLLTATKYDGTVEENNCNEWTDGTNVILYSAAGGYSTRTRSSWTDYFQSGCGSSHYSLICFEVGAGAPLPEVASVGKKVFSTSVKGTGDLSTWSDAGGQTGLAAGDAICQARAAAAGLANASNFKAWLSDDITDAKDRITSNGPWVRLDGIKIADNKADLLDGELFVPINLTETLVYLGNSGYFTGTASDGTKTVDNCNNWTSSDEIKGEIGFVNDTYDWTEAIYPFPMCHNSSASGLYCFED